MALPPLLVKINGDSSGLDTALGKAGKGLKSLGVIAAGAAIAVVGGLAAMTTAGLRSVDANVKLARSMGGTVNALNAVQIAAGYAGVSVGEANSAMQNLNRELASANEKGSPAAKALERLGFVASELSDLDTDDRMAAIADRVQELGLSTSDTSDILRDLGVRSRNMALLMIQGGDAIRSARIEVAAFGLELSETQTAGIESANDALARMSLVFQGLQGMLAAEVAPTLQVIADKFNQIAQSEATREAINRVVESFGALAEIILSEDFMSAAATGLGLVASSAAILAEGMVTLSQNVEMVTLVAGGLAIAIAAIGGPITIVIGLLGVALVALSKWRGAVDGSTNASRSLTIAMGDEITQSQLLNKALSINGSMSVEVAKKKLIEARARHQNVSAIIAEQRALSLSGAAYVGLTENIDTAQDAMRGMGTRTLMNAASFDETEQTLAGHLEKRQRLLDVDKAAAEQLIRTQENIDSLSEKLASASGGMITTGGGMITPIDPTDPDEVDDIETEIVPEVGGAAAVTDELQQRLEALTGGLMTESEVLKVWREEGLLTLQESLEAGKITEEEYRQQRERLETEHQERMAGIRDAEGKLQLSATKGVLDRASGLMKTGNDKLFKIGQAAAIARASIAGIEAGVESYKWGASRGGPILGAAMAAVSLAQTGAMIAKIAGQSPSGSGGGGGSVGGGTGTGAVAAPQQRDVSEFNVTGSGINGAEELFTALNEGLSQGRELRINYTGA